MRGLRGLVILVPLVAAGCVGEDGEWPPVHDLVVSDPVRVDAEQPAREPAIAVLPDGTIFVAAFWGPVRYTQHPPATVGNIVQSPLLWKSTDDGDTWGRVDVGAALDGAVGNSDVSLATSADGVLYFAALTFQPLFVLPEPTSVNTLTVGASPDGGGTWTWTRIDAGERVDRPWLAVDPDGVAHLVWNDGGGIYHVRSADEGRTWSERVVVSERGGDGGFAAGPDGLLAARVVPWSGNGFVFDEDADGVAVSEDGGATWDVRGLPSTPFDRGGPIPRLWDPIVIDAGGALFAVWTAGLNFMELGRSDDRGATWDVRTVVSQQGEASPPFLPFLEAGPDPGTLAITWFSDENAAPNATARIAFVPDAAQLRRAIIDGAVLERDAYANGEYFEVTFLDESTLGVVVPRTDESGQWLDFRRVGLP